MPIYQFPPGWTWKGPTAPPPPPAAPPAPPPPITPADVKKNPWLYGEYLKQQTDISTAEQIAQGGGGFSPGAIETFQAQQAEKQAAGEFAPGAPKLKITGQSQNYKDYLTSFPEWFERTTNPSMVLQALEHNSAPPEALISYWRSQGKSFADIPPVSTAGSILYPALVKTQGAGSTETKEAYDHIVEQAKEQFGTMARRDKSLEGAVFAGLDKEGNILYFPRETADQLKLESPGLYHILISQGADAYNKELSRLQAIFDKYTVMQRRPAPYPGVMTPEEKTFDLLSAVKDKVPIKDLNMLGISDGDISSTKAWISAEENLSGYLTDKKTNTYDWTAIIADIKNNKVSIEDAKILFGDKAVEDSLGETALPQGYLSDTEYQKLDLYKPLGEAAIREHYGDAVVDKSKEMAEYQGIKWTGEWIHDPKRGWVRPTLLSKLCEEGDLRAIWGVETWSEAEAYRSYRELMNKQITDLSVDDFNILISKPFVDLETAVSQIKAPKLTPWYQETPWADKVLQGIAGGIGTTALATVLFPMTIAGLAGMAVKHPKEAGATALVVGGGMVDWTKDTVVNTWKDPAYGIPYFIFTIGPMAYGAGKFALKTGARVVIWVHPKGVPLSLIAKEYSMGRIPAEIEGLSKANIGGAVGQALKEATSPGGGLSGEVTVGEVTARYLKTPYEKVIGDSLWHGTDDISFVDTKGLYKGLKPHIGEQIIAGLRDIDAPIVRKLNLADVESVPKQIAPELQAILQKYNARLYGSIVEWMRLKDAPRPGDIDVAVPKKYRAAALRDIQNLLKEKGISCQRVRLGIDIIKDGKLIKLLDIDTVEHHLRWYPEGYKPLPADYLDKVYIEKLGEQITRRGSALIKSGAEGRTKDLPKFKQDVEALAKEKPQYKELLDRFTEDVEMFIKAKGNDEPGIYFSPYAAELFASGDNPGLVLLLTDTNRIKGVPSAVLAQAGQSDWFIRQANKGLYEPSKNWYRAFETEIVASPGTEFKVPPPTADFIQRMLAGKSTDLFSYSTRQERFLPIRVVADKGVLPELPSNAKLYGVKLHALAVSVQNFIESLKHPKRTLVDIVQGRPGPKGLREVEIVGVDIRRANSIDAITARLDAEARAKASKLTKNEADFKRILEEETEKVYQKENKRLLDMYRNQVEKEYQTKAGRERFEDIYRYHIERDFRTLARSRQFARNLAPTLSRAREETEREVRRGGEGLTERRGIVPSERERPVITTRREVPVRPRLRERQTRDERTRTTERGRREEREQRRRDERTRRETERIRETTIAERLPVPIPQTEEKGRPTKESEAKASERRRQEFAGSTGWQQGFVIYALKPPHASRADVAIFHKKNPPPGFILVKGGPEAAFRSIQSMTGKSPEKLRIDLGIQDILISSPHRKPGAPGAIGYKQDIGQRTRGDITITSTGRGKPRIIKGEAEETLPVSPLGSSKMPKEIAAAIGSYSAKVGADGQVKVRVKRL